jgi:hypothetical protein
MYALYLLVKNFGLGGIAAIFLWLALMRKIQIVGLGTLSLRPYVSSCG